MLRLAKTLLAVGLALTGACLPVDGEGSNIERRLVVDVRPREPENEVWARGLEELAVAELAELPSLEPLGTEFLVAEAGGLAALPTETRDPASTAPPVLVVGEELHGLDVQLYLLGELRRFAVGVDEPGGASSTRGFVTQTAVAELRLRLYLMGTGELLAQSDYTAELTASGVERHRPGEPIGDDATFTATLEGRALTEAAEGAVGRLVREIARAPWNGFIEDLTADDGVILPLGYRDGAAPGDVFIIYEPGAERGRRGNRVGSVRLEAPGNDESYAPPLSGGGFKPGYLVIQELKSR
jgi:hypothetical protein